MIDNARSVGQVYTAIFGMVDHLNDSHTMFMPPGRTQFPQFGFEAKAYGDKVFVTKLKKKGGARSAGLQLGDQILQVNGFDAERASFDKMMLFFHVLQPVSELELLVQRGKEAPQKIVVKAFVKPPTRLFDAENELNLWELVTDAESDEEEAQKSSYIAAEENSGIGYFALNSFNVLPETATSWATLMGKAKGVIVDLRGNFGGAHDTLVAFTGKFSSEPSVMGDLIGRKKTEPIKIKPGRGAYTVPMVILIDSQSASSAEMFARHFQRLKRATVIGDRSRGAVVQARMYWEKLGTDRFVPFGVHISTAKVMFPDNENLEGKGVLPDQMCIPTGEDLRAHRDPCYSMAMQNLSKQLGIELKDVKKTAGETAE
jgi:carboxyl-terminal processing protease